MSCRSALLFLVLIFLSRSCANANDDPDSNANITSPPVANSSSSDSDAEGIDPNATSSSDESANGTGTNVTIGPSPVVLSPLQNMYINTAKPALGSTTTETVFSNNALVSTFNSCTLETKVNSSDCFADDMYNDRLEFQIVFHYDANLIRDAFTSRPPSLSTASFASALASPAIVTATVHDDDSTASIIVRYNCKQDNHGIVPIRLLIHFGNDSDSANVAIHWQKACESGVQSKILFGYLSGNSADGSTEQHEFGGDDAPLVIVNPSDESTEFFLKLDVPGAQQEFLAPHITSSKDNVAVSVRGNHPQGGVLQGLESTSFQIGYDCLKQGETTIEATIAIPPFKNVSATWKKDCGGKAAYNIQVGSEEGGFDIVDNGQATPRYMVAIENIGADHSEEHLHLPGNQSEWVFYVKNDEDVSTSSEHTAMHIGRLSSTVEQPDVVFPQPPIVLAWDAGSWTVTQRSSYILRAGESLKVIMPLICRNIGESRVLITVPVLNYKQLEFGVAKECTHIGRAMKAEEFVFTVGKLLWTVVFFVIFVLALFYVRRRAAEKASGFERVSVTER